MKSKFKKGDVLLIVDPQIDFMPAGNLGVHEGDKIVPIVNEWITAAEKAGIPIIVSRDWHPKNHISFKEQGGPWPAHCVQNTKGAEFHPQLKLTKHVTIINKAFDPSKDAYSAFAGVTDKEGKPLPEKLRELKTKRLWIGGLAFDYCVKHSALDARKHKFDVHIILPACRSIASDTEQDAFRKMTEAEVIFETDADPYIK